MVFVEGTDDRNSLLGLDISRGKMKASYIQKIINISFNELFHRPNGQIPALDGLRTLAIFCVIAGHMGAEICKIQGGIENWVNKLPFVRGGWMGVDLFFVLSGYFIGKQLWRELDCMGTVNIKRFILRRGLRIWPLYIFFFIFSGFILGRAQFPFGQGWSDLLFLTNYLNHGVVMGSWSLCTEEQFYIAAPLLLVLGASLPFTLTKNSYQSILVGLLFLLPIIRAITWWSVTGSFHYNTADQASWAQFLYTPFHTHCDGLIMGMLLSNLDVAGVFRKCVANSHFSTLAVPLSILICLILQKIQGEIFDFTGLALVFGAVIWFVLTNKKKWLSFLDSTLFYTLSRLSYGMYLNHEYMHKWVARTVLLLCPLWTSPAMKEILAIGILTVLSATVSVATFCAVEYPFLQLRERIFSRWYHRQ